MNDAVNVIRAIYVAYAARDLEGIRSRLSESARFIWPTRPELVPYAGIAEGREACMERLRMLDELFVFQSFEPIDIFGTRTRAAARISATITGRGMGRTEDLELGHFWRVEDGQAIELVEFFDTALVNLMN